MKISVEDGWICDITMNGIEVANVISADEEKGEIRAYLSDVNGDPVQGANGLPIPVVFSGEVKITKLKKRNETIPSVEGKIS